MALKNFPIEFVRQVIEQTLLEEHEKSNGKFFGGKDQVSLISFYEQLNTRDEVNRYVDTVRDLNEQQNRTNLIMNGTILAPENPTITNVTKNLIIPMSFTCSFRVRLTDRDSALETINNVIKVLKGRKQDIAEFGGSFEENIGKLLKVGTPGNVYDGFNFVYDGAFIGKLNAGEDTNTGVRRLIENLTLNGFNVAPMEWCYVEKPSDQDNNETYMFVAKKRFDEELQQNVWEAKFNEYDDNSPSIIFPPSFTPFEKYKISISFESVRCDEPNILNAKEYCLISFGGSATLVSDGVALGNDLVKLDIVRSVIDGETNIELHLDSHNWLEPLELPNNSSADAKMSQLISDKFVSKSHTNGFTLSISYTFILDKHQPLLKAWFYYSRYGIVAQAPDYIGITPNMIYSISEYFVSWGEIEKNTFNAKINGNIEVTNSESDVLTITTPMQPQGN